MALVPWLWQSFKSDVSVKTKNWVWITAETGLSDNIWNKRFYKLKPQGFHGVILQVYATYMALYESQFLPVQEPLFEHLSQLQRKLV